jgi:hypothetical protein
METSTQKILYSGFSPTTQRYEDFKLPAGRYSYSKAFPNFDTPLATSKLDFVINPSESNKILPSLDYFTWTYREGKPEISLAYLTGAVSQVTLNFRKVGASEWSNVLLEPVQGKEGVWKVKDHALPSDSLDNYEAQIILKNTDGDTETIFLAQPFKN